MTADVEHDILISYTGRESEQAERIYLDLVRYGASVWFDQVEMPHDHEFSGDEIRGVLAGAMRTSSALLILVSSRSMASRWVRFELETALALEARDPRRRIVTLLVARGSEREIPEAIRDRKSFDLRDHFEARYRANREEIFRDLVGDFDRARYRELFGAAS